MSSICTVTVEARELRSANETRALIAELIEMERIQRATEKLAASGNSDEPPPETLKSTPVSKSEPPQERDDEVRGAT